jgi:alkyl sulfatase BDS1-like metallo-beta-lactamase superfamily hydrolase
MMGGADAIMARAAHLMDGGDYLLAIEVLNKLVYGEPGNVAGRRLLGAWVRKGYEADGS